MKRLFAALLLILVINIHKTSAVASVDTVMVGSKTYVTDTVYSSIFFKFAPKRKMFFMDYEGNRDNIFRAKELLQRNIEDIRSGKLLVSVNGYCESFSSEEANRRMAKNRSNQVKSYYITHLGLKEEYYKTTNHTKAYKGDRNIVAMLQLILSEKAKAEMAKPDTTTVIIRQTESEPIQEPKQESVQEPATIQQEIPVDTVTTSPTADTIKSVEPEIMEYTNRWRLKTNIPFYALVIPNLAMEWLFKDRWSLDVPLFYSPYTVARKYRFRTFTLQPSVRYWLRDGWKGHFVGVHVTGGRYNISVDDRYRYQDVNSMWGTGLDYGYAWRFSKHWGLEFNIGAGMIYSKLLLSAKA